MWLRLTMYLAGWPHLVDVALRTRKAPVASTPRRIVWRHKNAVLYRYRGEPKLTEPILIVHALVSKPWILDLSPQSSFVGYLLESGFDVFLLDWGDPDGSDAQMGLSSYGDVLMHAERQVLAATKADRMHLVGYCLGGTLALARMGARSHLGVGSLTLLAAPVDFAIPAGLQPFMAHPLFKPVFLLDRSGCVPPEVVRESFHVLRPQAIRTVVAAWRRRRDVAFRSVYDPMARWVWEHRRLPGRLFFDLVDLFRNNSLVEERLEVAGELARLRDVRCPILLVIPERDHITPSGSSHVLSTVPQLSVTILNAASGHVSMVAGSAAKAHAWPAIAAWLEEHQGR